MRLENHKSHSLFEVGKASGNHPIPPPAQSQISYSRLLRYTPSWVLNISEYEDSPTSLGTLLQYLATFTVKKKKKKPFFYCSDQVSCVSVRAHCPFLFLGTTGRWTYLYILMRSPWAVSSPGSRTQLSQPFHVGEMCEALNSLHGPSLSFL